MESRCYKHYIDVYVNAIVCVSCVCRKFFRIQYLCTYSHTKRTYIRQKLRGMKMFHMEHIWNISQLEGTGLSVYICSNNYNYYSMFYSNNHNMYLIKIVYGLK